RRAARVRRFFRQEPPGPHRAQSAHWRAGRRFGEIRALLQDGQGHARAPEHVRRVGVLGTLGTILKWVILLPVLLAVVLLAVANDQTVTLHLNPFDKADPVLKVDLALYQVMFLIFVIGVLIGGLV